MNTIHTAIASFGMSGTIFHGPLLKANPHFEVTRILERTKSLSMELFPEAEIARCYEEILQDPMIELVIVNTPDHLHYEMVKQALQLGKHVVVEKPFVQSYEQAIELIELAKKKQLLLSVFQNRRWDGDFLTVQKVLEEGKLGRLVEFESRFERFRTELYDSWKEQEGYGTSVVYNLGSHLIDQALCLFGMPNAVSADLRMLREGIKIHDFFDVTLYYTETKVRLQSSYLAKNEAPRFVLRGTEGAYVKYGIDPQEAAMKAGNLPNTKNWGVEDSKYHGKLLTDKETTIKTIAGNYPAYYQNIYEVIRLKEELLVKPEEAAEVIKIIEAIHESAQTGIRISF